MKKLKKDTVGLAFPKLGNINNLYLLIMSDAAWANLQDGVSSGGGHLVFLVGQNARVCPLTWKSNKIKRVIKSTIAAEALALQEGIDHAIYLRAILREMTGKAELALPIEAWVDSANVEKALKSTTQVIDHRLRVDIAIIKETVEREGVTVRWCPGEEMLANPLTKRGASSERLLNVLRSGSIDGHFQDGRKTGVNLKWKK